ncbi:tRNA (guanosine(46)-N7)-methyltransferase TrmB [Granulosicoccaceae sp. 1_MG-2023]|nr:tRNA (guanosine(46)-N7)-methyltransferase TrmB [Granulosicoccaceae sp. 1_MG-2023]
MVEKQKLTSRSVRSFVVRSGRITEAQQRAMAECWPRYGIDYREAPIDWAAEFGREAPLWIEIGFGNGIQTAAIAEKHPEINVLGIEVHLPGVGHLLNLAEKNALSNLRIMRHDAVEVLQNCVLPAQAERILLFFPDPWHKKRHHKRRIVQADFVSLVTSRLHAGGMFHLATDWEPYAEWMVEVLDAEPGLRNTAVDGAFVKAPDYRILTKFENRGLKHGHGVWDLLYKAGG